MNNKEWFRIVRGSYAHFYSIKFEADEEKDCIEMCAEWEDKLIFELIMKTSVQVVSFKGTWKYLNLMLNEGCILPSSFTMGINGMEPDHYFDMNVVQQLLNDIQRDVIAQKEKRYCLGCER